jgi:hypothetical protein
MGNRDPHPQALERIGWKKALIRKPPEEETEGDHVAAPTRWSQTADLREVGDVLT